MPELTQRIEANLAEIRQRIAAAAARAGRRAEEVTLVAVTKEAPLEAVRALVACGCGVLGESRPQQLWDRAKHLADLPVRWHLIGHLQRNKVRRTLPLVALVHSVDSPRLLAAIDEAAAETGTNVPLLLEVNISAEPAKHGLTPAEVEPCLVAAAGCRNVAVRGLMCMAAFAGGPDDARRDFAALRQLRDRLRGVCPPGVALDELSMGMSSDYEQAIEEGATLVRVGSALFEGIGP
jgi:PLP dependent protein